MRVKEAMTSDPVCCLATDSAQQVAGVLRKLNVGSIPVVADHKSRKLIGIITDRDLCCSVVAGGLDPRSTPIEKAVTMNPVSCRDDMDLGHCERMMQNRQVRRIPIVDGEARVIGIVSLADLALKGKPDEVAKTVAEVSKPPSSTTVAV